MTEEPWLVDLRRFGQVDFPAILHDAREVLPGGHAEYVAVMHDLEVPTEEGWQYVRWSRLNSADPWSEVRDRVETLSPEVTDIEMSLRQRQLLWPFLEDALSSFAPVKKYFCVCFGYENMFQASPDEMRNIFLDTDAVLPSFFTPESQEWSVSVPFDAGWTYLGLGRGRGSALLNYEELEVLSCTYH